MKVPVLKLSAFEAKRLLTSVLIGSLLGFGVVLVGCDGERASDAVGLEAGLEAGSSEAKANSLSVSEGTAASFYVVDHYDAQRDPAKDLEAAMARATAEEKRILIQVGGDWCGWCKLMSKYMESNEVVREHLTKNFLVMKVTYEDGQKNEAFLSKYPAISGYPHLYVVDGDGTLLHSQETGSLEEGRGYNEEKFVAFLDAWKL